VRAWNTQTARPKTKAIGSATVISSLIGTNGARNLMAMHAKHAASVPARTYGSRLRVYCSAATSATTGWKR
jgi:hypothetical protein